MPKIRCVRSSVVSDKAIAARCNIDVSLSDMCNGWLT